MTVEVDDRTHEDPPTAHYQPDEDYGGWTETRSAFARPAQIPDTHYEPADTPQETP